METKHTEEKWEVDGFKIRSGEKTIAEIFANRRGNRVPTFNEARANAILISEAPETLWKLHETNKKLQSLIDNDCIKGVGTILTIKGMIRVNNEQIEKSTK